MSSRTRLFLLATHLVALVIAVVIAVGTPKVAPRPDPPKRIHAPKSDRIRTVRRTTVEELWAEYSPGGRRQEATMARRARFGALPTPEEEAEDREKYSKSPEERAGGVTDFVAVMDTGVRVVNGGDGESEGHQFYKALLERWINEDPEAAHLAFAQALTGRAVRFERWNEVFQVLEGLDGRERIWALDGIEGPAASALSQRGRILPLLEASVQSGNWEVLERSLARSRNLTPPDSPAVFLEWAFGAGGPATDPVAVRHAVDFALRSNREATLEWIAQMDDPAAQRRAQQVIEVR